MRRWLTAAKEAKETQSIDFHSLLRPLLMGHPTHRLIMHDVIDQLG